MRIKEVGYVVERLADRFRDLGGQMAAQEAAHKTALEELRAGFNARIASDKHRLENLREEIIRLNEAHGRTMVERDGLRAEFPRLQSALDALQGKVREMAVSLSKSLDERDALRAEVSALQERLRACEPCDPPTADHDTPEGKDVAESVIRDDRKTEPKPGDTVRLVRIPSRDVVSPELQTALQWPWIERWGTLNQTAMVVEPRYQLDGAVSVCLSTTNAHVCWPINCLEVVTDDIKVGDLVEVVSATHRLYTEHEDLGCRGVVTVIDGMRLLLGEVPGYKLPIRGIVGKCDVRKVTT